MNQRDISYQGEVHLWQEPYIHLLWAHRLRWTKIQRKVAQCTITKLAPPNILANAIG